MQRTTIVIGINPIGSISLSEYPGKAGYEIGAIPADLENIQILYSSEEVLEKIKRRIEECRARGQ